MTVDLLTLLQVVGGLCVPPALAAAAWFLQGIHSDLRQLRDLFGDYKVAQEARIVRLEAVVAEHERKLTRATTPVPDHA